MPDSGESCVLLFSGGRDSTLAGLRLARCFDSLLLVTVTSGHLVGIEAVHRRLAELRRCLPSPTRWLHVRQDMNLPRPHALGALTCLPCHRAYASIGVAMALQVGARFLAFGYTAYQSSWAEQTPEAIVRLRRLLAQRDIELLLPVQDVLSREAAIEELRSNGLESAALEQKCLQQQFNLDLPPTMLGEELDAWEQDLAAALAAVPQLRLHILADLAIGDTPTGEPTGPS